MHNVTRNTIVTMYFNRGTYVTWQDVTDHGLGQVVTRHGIIECELTTSPGWYYVRNEHGDLEKLQWVELRLAEAKK